MNEIDELTSTIKSQIIKTYIELKTRLFRSSGKVFDRDWEDLTPKYKNYKTKKLGSAYPINIFTGDLFNNVLDKALSVEAYYDQHSDKMNFKIDVDTNRIQLEYADAVNEKREYISFSPEEKKILTEVAIQTIQSFYERMQ